MTEPSLFWTFASAQVKMYLGGRKHWCHVTLQKCPQPCAEPGSPQGSGAERTGSWAEAAVRGLDGHSWTFAVGVVWVSQ